MRIFNSQILKTLGPGILFASTAIGVSHLVQSTRAGAGYGLSLVLLVLFTNLMKYPFFEFGSRYANIKNKSIIDGYLSLGKWVFWAYILVTICSMFFVTAAVGVVTAGFFNNLFHVDSLLETNSLLWVVVFIFLLSLITLILGRYKTLDSLIKIIGSVLLVSTLIAFVLTLNHGPVSELSMFPKINWKQTDVLFLIALMGWMPTAVDMSAWNSLWTVERIKQTGYQPTLKQTLFDFNFGYSISAVLSICFIFLGAYLMFGSGNELSNKSHIFSSQVVALYTETIGDWSLVIIGAASFSIMFGTCIAVFDGYARAIGRCFELIKGEGHSSAGKVYNGALTVTALGAFLVIYITLFALKDDGKGFTKLIDLATTISFLIAPFIAIANYILVTNKNFPKESQPKRVLRILSILGIVFLLGFSLLYLFY